MDPAPGEARRPAAQPEARQRWRLTYARHDPASAATIGREYAALWQDAIVRSGLPALVQADGRPRVVFAAPLPVGLLAARELLDLWLLDPRTAWQVREGLEPVLPAGHALVELENVWLGAPALPGRVVGAEYRVGLASSGKGTLATLRATIESLLAAERLPRERAKAGGTKSYDLRPLIRDISLEETVDGAVIVLRTVSQPDLGSGRPDEILAAIGALAGRPVDAESITRERLELA